MNDNVNHPSHYTSGPLHSACGLPIEAIDVTRGHTFSDHVDSAVTEVPTLPDTHQPRTSTVRAVFGDRYIGTLECSCGHFVAGVQGVTRSRLVLELSSVYTKHLRDVWGA